MLMGVSDRLAAWLLQILNAKLKRLEHLLRLKDMRLEELESRINGAAGLKSLYIDDM
jgi:hypothetical protein